MEHLDTTFRRAWEIFIGDLSDETDAELEALLPPLVDAGYVEISGESPTGHFWVFTPDGVAHARALGLD